MLEIRTLNKNDKKAFFKYVQACLNDNTKFGVFAKERYENFDFDKFDDFCDELELDAKNPVDPKKSRQVAYFGFENNVIVGSIRCRLDIEKEDLLQFGGHIGYDVPEYARGNHVSEKLCQFAFDKYRENNVKRVLLVIDEDNYASRHVAEKFNGTIENWVYEPDDNAKVARYWIEL
ncbi:GNAT family N-acetyltransferase [Weissella bombi]|uniref:Predicted acetyltransferase n=1 Tax=Weissella bombi TaxID=1505725 RepID=A0A1C3YY74_9LACO|nr:GNAT family N-acetyltransferase [Weissella bombi]SCB75067.1 Predicted acetyltransferase [Weissella bombi]